MSVLGASAEPGNPPAPAGPIAEQPVLLVTGDGIISGGIYSATNVGLEKSYTLGELQVLTDITVERFYSANSNSPGRRNYRGIGVDVEGLLALSGYVDNGTVFAISPGTSGLTTPLDLNETRNYYPGFAEDNEAEPISAMLAWQSKYNQIMYDNEAGEWPGIPEIPDGFDDPNASDSSSLRLLLGQTAPDIVSTNLFNSGVNQLRAGNAVASAQITVNGTTYTRAEILMMPRLAGSYTYTSSGGDRTDSVRGVPLAILLDGLDDSDVIAFNAADGYDMSSYNMKKSELVAKNAILAYETFEDTGWQGIYSTAKASAPNPSGIGYFTLYADGITPGKMIDTISLKPSTASSYKHITNGGQGGSAPYNIDAITSATLTVEGPGVESSVPITVRELEETRDDNIHRGVYTDVRSGASTTRMYEGIKVSTILDGQVNSNVRPLDDSVVVVFKNRWRQEVGRLTYGEIKSAAVPVILAYGTASTDEIAMPPAPFVFNMGAGSVAGLGNEDGPLKLVYDQSAFPYAMPANSTFASIAYMYIEEGVPPPGFKHISSTNEAYNNVANTEFILTFTGDELGREVNYTVKELEEMAGTDPSLVHRSEYGLSNTTYWYVNEYEGIMLWNLLQKMGVPASKAADDSALVSFSSWDNYQISSQFSFYQLAHPELFYFYEKSPLDMGTDRPTKEQLATPEYQPDNQVGTWTTDDNGYPVKTGYPVLLAYGVNSYPYVRNPGMDGYRSGLGNSGGPMRLIYGKTDGLNRSDPSALENYAYFFNNGSQQLQRVQEVYVGNPVRYSTHIENPDPAYQSIKDDSALTVEINAGGATRTETFTLTELENILYGSGVSKTDRDDGRQEKGYYVYRSNIQDLFEGVNLEYLLAEYIGMQGTLGTVDLYSGADLAASFSLSSIYSSGKNALRGTAGLGMTVAFAKNGYPLVAGSGNGNADNANPDHDNYIPGYVHDDAETGNAIRNIGGPLVFVRGQTGAETGGNVESGVDGKTYVANLTKIVVNLDADPYAHVGAGNEGYAAQEILFSGAVAKAEGVSLAVGVLETKQRYMVTDSYTVGGTTDTYRGLDLYKLLGDRDIGASSLMDEITIINGSGDKTTLTYSQLTAAGKKIILAYGSGGAGSETPLDAAAGGPMRLIIDGGDAADCISNVAEIIVHAAEITSWKHEGPVYSQYANYTLEISGQNLAYNKTFTAAELEAMDNIILQDVYKVGNDIVAQGVDLYKLLQNIGFANGLESSEFTAYASDGFSIQFNSSQLTNGINGKPILIAFGQGTTADNGLPLVPNANSPGYSAVSVNDCGPLRLMVHDNSGWAVKYLVKIVVGAAGGNPDPAEYKDFNIFGLKSGFVAYDIRTLKNLPDGLGAKTETFTYTSGGSVTDTVKGAYLYDLLKANGVGESATITVNTTDKYETSQADYRDIPMSVIKDQKYFVAYDVGADKVEDADKSGAVATVRIYRNFNDGSNWRNRLTNIMGVTVTDYDFNIIPGGANGLPQASVRAVVEDSAGGVWIGTNGAGAAYISASGVITRYATDTMPALKTDFVTGIAIAPDGTVWLTQGGSVGSINAPSTAHYGFASFKNGSFTFYDADSPNSTLPSNCVYGIDVDVLGNVWLTSQYTTYNAEGGLTKFNPATGVWQSWTKSDGLPTVSAWTVKGDGKGGAWVTTYRSSMIDLPWPDESFAYVSPAGVVTSYPIPNGIDLTWSRSISIAPNGGVYITRMSGAHDPSNAGGWLDYIAADGSAKSYKGDDLIPDLKAKAKLGFYPEIRTVFVDVGGNLWLTTNGLGVFRCYLASDGKITVVENYSSETGCWPAGSFDDVWSINVTPNGRAYFGSNGGVVWADVDITPPTPPLPPPPPPPGGDDGITYIGDATATTAELTITGAVAKPGYFTIEGLKGYPGVIARTGNYSWLNNAGSTDTDTMTGIYLENLLLNVMALTPDAVSVTVTANDGYSYAFNLDSSVEVNGRPGVYATDITGNKMMLAWRGTNSRTDRNIIDFDSLRLVVGQTSAEHINRMMWVSDIVKITVNSKPADPPGAGNYAGTSISDADTPLASAEEITVTVALTIDAKTEVADGVVSAANTADDMRDALSELSDKAADQPGAGKQLSIDARTDEETDKTVYTLTAESLKLLTEDGQTSIEIAADQGSITLSAELLKYLEDNGEGSLVIEISEDEADGELVADITILRGGSVISSFGGLLLKVDIPVELTASQQEEGLLVYRVEDNGRKTLIKLASYDPDSGSIRIGLTHLSKYVISYNLKTFPDIQGNSGQSYIEFLASRDIVNGYSADTFRPNGNVTRAEFIKMLAESVDGVDLTATSGSGFSDVANGAWYAKYVTWAAGLGIVQGYPDGTLNPNGQISREEMAVMTDRFVRAMKLDLKVVRNASDFTDKDQIGSYASGAIRAMQQYGILGGNPDGSYNPKGAASRAEAAKVVNMYIEAVLR